MTLYLKRLVSGKKARYRDDQLSVELDLAYVTDKIIVMGFPAVGVESIYRNHRADVQRFLSARHGSDFWVFNFCPVRENAYDESVFQHRVSRYPFPDHHVPPFLYLPLVTREMDAWLSGSDARVAVLHCKAGKGRSGTLACAYLLSRYASPSTPLPALHDTLGDWSLIGDKDGLQTPSSEISTDRIDPPASVPLSTGLSRVSSEPVSDTLEMVLNLHTSKRMKPPRFHPDVSKKTRMGVSIPSQRRWLFYWSQVLAGKGPPSLQRFQTSGHSGNLHEKSPQIAQVRLTKLTVRMREPPRIQPHFVQAASVVMTSTGKGRAMSESTTGKLWACLARYRDHLIDKLEEESSGSTMQSSFKSDRWDRSKMIRSFAQMGISDVQTTQQGTARKPVLTYVLRPINGGEGDRVKLQEPIPWSDHQSPQQSSPGSGSSSFAIISPLVTEEDTDNASGIVLEADRELRIKLFMGEVSLGWVWIIPAFHVSPNALSSNIVFPSDDIDFGIGIGKTLIDMKISFAPQTCNQAS